GGLTVLIKQRHGHHVKVPMIAVIRTRVGKLLKISEEVALFATAQRLPEKARTDLRCHSDTRAEIGKLWMLTPIATAGRIRAADDLVQIGFCDGASEAGYAIQLSSRRVVSDQIN